MTRPPAWRRYLRFWGANPESDVDDELRFHLETKAEELVAAGMAPEQARREARRQFGPVRPVLQECFRISQGRQAQASRAEYWIGWLGDVKYALRVLGRARASTAAAVVILAIGIGANTAVFTFLDRLLFRPLPVPRPSELVMISPSTGENFSYAGYTHLRDGNQTFSGLGAEAALVARERRGHEKIQRPAVARIVSGNYFEVMGEKALVGRTLLPSDDVRSAASHVAVASHRFWTRRYNRVTDAIGSIVYLNAIPFKLVGVLPDGFSGMHKGATDDLYIPLGALPEIFTFDPLVQGRWMWVFGRVRRGVPTQTARSNLQFLADQLPGAGKVELRDGSRGTDGIRGQERRSFKLLAGIAGLLLLMGCVNVSCLLMARGAARQQEVAIRLSLGAGRRRVLRQSLIESSLVALAGGAAGMAVAYGAGRLLFVAFRWEEQPIALAPDWRILAFSLGLSLLTGVLFGIAPAAQFLRSGHVPLNQERTVAPRFTTGKALVVLEVALSLVMVAGAVVFVKSFQNLRSVPIGFSPKNVSVAALAPDKEVEDTLRMPAREAMVLADSLAGASAIQSTALADLLPFDDAGVANNLRVPGGEGRKTNILRVSDSYFSTLGVSQVAGRVFARRDDESAAEVAILTEGTAQRLLPDRNWIGKHILVGARDLEVVGVVKDMKLHSVARPAPDLVLLPILQGTNYSTTVKLHVRSSMAVKDLSALIRARIRDGRLPVRLESIRALEDAVGASLRTDRLRMQASSLFGVLALALIIAGIYGLMGYSVARRTREIGIRMAVGSKPSEIVALVLRESLSLVLLGVAVGVPGAVAVMHALTTMVFGLAPVDFAALLIAAGILGVTGIAATVAPAWRAARLDPVKALRVQ